MEKRTMEPAQNGAYFGQRPAGLRLPLQLLPNSLIKRAMVIEVQPTYVDLFLPPLLTAQFESLIRMIYGIADQPNAIRWQSYVPVDLPADWSRIAFTADPGVLEVNLPPALVGRPINPG